MVIASCADILCLWRFVYRQNILQSDIHQFWGFKPQKQKITAVLQDHFDLQGCGIFAQMNISPTAKYAKNDLIVIF